MGLFHNLLTRDSRDYVIAALGVIASFVLLNQPSLTILLHFGVSLVVCVGSDIAFKLWQKQPPFPLRSSLITGLLIGLVLDVTTPIPLTFSTCLLAIAPKYLLKRGPKHIFNPAAFGLVSSQLLFNTQVTWWGVSAYPLSMIILGLVMAFVFLKRLKLWPMPLAFLGSYQLYLWFKFSSFLPQRLLDPTVFLFALVMLPEYKTSPIIGHWRYTFGILVAAVFIVLLEVFKSIPADPLLLSLLLSNSLSFILTLNPLPKRAGMSSA